MKSFSQDVLEKVATDLKTRTPSVRLASKIKVTVPVDTRIVSISVTDRVPEEASRIAKLSERGCRSKIISVTRVSDVTTPHVLQHRHRPQIPVVILWLDFCGERRRWLSLFSLS